MLIHGDLLLLTRFPLLGTAGSQCRALLFFSFLCVPAIFFPALFPPMGTHLNGAATFNSDDLLFPSPGRPVVSNLSGSLMLGGLSADGEPRALLVG